MSVKFLNCVRERSEMLYRICLHSSFNNIDFQCMRSIQEHITVETISPLYLKFFSVPHRSY